MFVKILTTLLMTTIVWAQVPGEKKKKIVTLPNVEIKGRYMKDNPNFLYMKTDKEVVKIKKAELTVEGIKQILANKEVVLTLFIPEKSVVSRTPRTDIDPEDEK